jgi:hypothetical protein
MAYLVFTLVRVGEGPYTLIMVRISEIIESKGERRKEGEK